MWLSLALLLRHQLREFGACLPSTRGYHAEARKRRSVDNRAAPTLYHRTVPIASEVSEYHHSQLQVTTILRIRHSLDTKNSDYGVSTSLRTLIQGR